MAAMAAEGDAAGSAVSVAGLVDDPIEAALAWHFSAVA